MMKLIQKTVAPLKFAISNMVCRGVLQLVNDSLKMQGVQLTLMADETMELERFQNYGFTSNPRPGSEALALFLNGNKDHGVVIAIQDRDGRKIDLESGDTAVYCHQGNYIRLQAENGKIYIDAPHNVIIRSDETVRLEGKNVEIHAEEMLKVDCLGNGFVWTPTTRADFVIGASSGTVAIAPPEVPPAPAT